MNQFLLPLATHLPCEGHLLKLSQEFHLHFLQQFDYFSKSEKVTNLTNDKIVQERLSFTSVNRI